MDPRQVVIKPVVSEKSYGLFDQGVYTFEVHPDSNKIEIRQAIEIMFNVKVKNVNTLTSRAKSRCVVPVRPSPKESALTASAPSSHSRAMTVSTCSSRLR